jgi:hypothetical protein
MMTRLLNVMHAYPEGLDIAARVRSRYYCLLREAALFILSRQEIDQ